MEEIAQAAYVRGSESISPEPEKELSAITLHGAADAQFIAGGHLRTIDNHPPPSHKKKGTDWDRGKPHGSSPPTPPDMRVRIRRFGGLSDRIVSDFEGVSLQKSLTVRDRFLDNPSPQG